jgi:hypothetical protein
MGNPLLDISSVVDQALLDKYGVSTFPDDCHIGGMAQRSPAQ